MDWETVKTYGIVIGIIGGTLTVLSWTLWAIRRATTAWRESMEQLNASMANLQVITRTATMRTDLGFYIMNHIARVEAAQGWIRFNILLHGVGLIATFMSYSVVLGPTYRLFCFWFSIYALGVMAVGLYIGLWLGWRVEVMRRRLAELWHRSIRAHQTRGATEKPSSPEAGDQTAGDQPPS